MEQAFFVHVSLSTALSEGVGFLCITVPGVFGLNLIVARLVTTGNSQLWIYEILSPERVGNATVSYPQCGFQWLKCLGELHLPRGVEWF